MFRPNERKVDSLRKQIEFDSARSMWASVRAAYSPSQIKLENGKYVVKMLPVAGTNLPVVSGANETLAGLKRELVSRFQDVVFSETASSHDVRLGESRRDMLRERNTAAESLAVQQRQEEEAGQGMRQRRELEAQISDPERCSLWNEIKSTFLDRSGIKNLPADFFTMHNNWNEQEILNYLAGIGIDVLPNIAELKAAYLLLERGNHFYKLSRPLKRSEQVYAPQHYTPPQPRVYSDTECEQMRVHLGKTVGQNIEITEQKARDAGLSPEQFQAVKEYTQRLSQAGKGKDNFENLQRQVRSGFKEQIPLWHGERFSK